MAIVPLNCVKRGEVVIDFDQLQPIALLEAAILENFSDPGNWIVPLNSDYMPCRSAFSEFAYPDGNRLGYECSFVRRDGVMSIYRAPNFPMYHNDLNPVLKGNTPFSCIMGGNIYSGYFNSQTSVAPPTDIIWPMMVNPFYEGLNAGTYLQGPYEENCEADYTIPVVTPSGYWTFFLYPDLVSVGLLTFDDASASANGYAPQTGTSNFNYLFEEPALAYGDCDVSEAIWPANNLLYVYAQDTASSKNIVFECDPNPNGFANNSFELVFDDAADEANLLGAYSYMSNNNYMFAEVVPDDVQYTGMIFVFEPAMDGYLKTYYKFDTTNYNNWWSFIDKNGDYWLQAEDVAGNFWAIPGSPVTQNTLARFKIGCGDYCTDVFMPFCE